MNYTDAIERLRSMADRKLAEAEGLNDMGLRAAAAEVALDAAALLVACRVLESINRL